MERFSQRESVLLGYGSLQRSFENPSSSLELPTRDSDVDFNDVFGGPPRRSSIHERGYSFGGGTKIDFEDTATSSQSPLPSLNEKPVFGEDSVNRRRYPTDDFYDDIFRGSDESYSSPRRSSMPASRVLSPAHPLPPKSEPFGTSLPANFSLPAKLIKAMDLPACGSSSRSPYKYKEGSLNVHTPNTSLSRFSSEAIPGQDDLRNDVKPSNGQSLLSQEISLNCEELSYMTKSTENEIAGNRKGETKSAEAPTNSSQFHFSICRWASMGVPLLIPLQRGKSSTHKGSVNIERCLRSKGRVESDTKVGELSKANVQDTESLFLDDDLSANNVSFQMEGEKQNKTNAKNIVESCQIVEELKSFETMQCTAENFLGGTALSSERGEIKPYSLPEMGLSEEIEKEISMIKQEANKPELKSLRSLLHDLIEGQGDEEIKRKAEGKKNVEKMTSVSQSNVGASSIKKHNQKEMNTKRAEVNKATVGSPINSRDDLVKSRVKGKVKAFVKIFNVEAPPKTKTNVVTRIQSSRWKATGTNVADNESSDSTSALDSKMPVPNVNMMPDDPFTVEESNQKSNKQHSTQETTIHICSDNHSGQTDASPFSESLPCGSKVTVENIDDHFQENFQIKELSVDEDKLSQTEEDSEAIRVSDSKIQNWSNGKKGNIRSLLSTLQYVLWPESGWKPVPLVDIIEGNAVKRAYQKALLCLHPDKLQQKGAAPHKKYMAEKVFDILQEAWDHFNSLGSL